MSIKNAIDQYDTERYGDFLLQFPDQLKGALELNIPDIHVQDSAINSIVIAGMGGSAIGGELLASLFYDELASPVSVVRDYNLPAFVDKKTLVVVSSYSGNTEETISTYKQAKERGAVIICITTGGFIARNAEQDDIPIVTLPKGFQPRAAIGYSFIPPLRILRNVGLLSGSSDDILETITKIKSLKESFEPDNSESSEPLKLARRLVGKIPVIYTGPPPLNALGNRWKCQFNENSKVLAYCNFIPELNHNEIVGWDIDFAPAESIYPVFLRDKEEHPSVARRMEITQEILDKQNVAFSEVWSSGSSILTRAFSLLYYGDYTSYYLALLNKKNPTSIDNINFLKNKLKQPC